MKNIPVIKIQGNKDKNTNCTHNNMHIIRNNRITFNEEARRQQIQKNISIRSFNYILQ